MAVELDEFHREFFQEIVGSADAAGQFKEDVFFDLFCAHLVDAGEIESADRAAYIRPTGGMRVDGYGGDPIGGDGTLSLIIMDFCQAPEIGRLTATEMDAIFKRLSNFLAKSIDPTFANSLEETSAAFGLADMIARRWSGITRVRLFLISNRQLSARVDGRSAEEIEGRTITFSVWDVDRLHRFATAGHGREDILIDLEAEFGGGIPLLPAHLPGAGYEAYLAVVPGPELAAIYDKWGARLLEQNVRVFLQARGAVNKGIRNTIDNDPNMFFAYNNGIAATAEEAITREEGGSLLLTGLRNLQIVNGGQTTASIHAAFRRKVDLSNVFVQMKLSIVEPERTIEVVPKISEFANSQNRVNAADFFANHPFHVRIEEFSRRMFAPSADGTFRESKWFYERARGQYADARGLLTPAQRKKFDLDYPKNQLFSKTDLAKFLNVWNGHPDIVSKGAQKNFAHFAHAVGKEWSKQPDQINEGYYRQAIAKAIIFRATEKIVTDQTWYQGGYRANIVAYALAKMAHDVGLSGHSVDFEGIWRKQAIHPAMEKALAVVAHSVHDVLTAPSAGISNVTEWAKQQACWSRVKALQVDWPHGWQAALIDADEQRVQRRQAVKEQKVLNGIEAQTLVVKSGPDVWKELLEWGLRKRLLSPEDARSLQAAASMPAQLPNEIQSMKIVETLRRLRQDGCRIGEDLAV